MLSASGDAGRGVHRVLNVADDRFEQVRDRHQPDDVAVFDHDAHGTIHERMTAVSEWQGLLRDLRLYELARQLAQNDGHLISA